MPADRIVSTRKRGPIVAIAGAIIVTAVAVYFFVTFVHTPSRGVITSRPITFPDSSSEGGQAVFDGMYFSIGIPSSFALKRHDDSVRDGAILEQAYFSEPDLDSRKLAVTIERIPSGGMSEHTSYRFRSLHPETYRKDILHIANSEREIFVREKSVYEIVGYVEGSEMTAVISLTSAVKTTKELMPDFSRLVNEFRWRTQDESI